MVKVLPAADSFKFVIEDYLDDIVFYSHKDADEASDKIAFDMTFGPIHYSYGLKQKKRKYTKDIYNNLPAQTCSVSCSYHIISLALKNLVHYEVHNHTLVGCHQGGSGNQVPAFSMFPARCRPFRSVSFLDN